MYGFLPDDSPTDQLAVSQLWTDQLSD